MVSLAALAILCSGCAGDIAAEQRGLPTCNARPVDPSGFEAVSTEKVEAPDHFGHRYLYRSPEGQELEYLYGVAHDAAAGLPKKAQMPVATAGVGSLHGDGAEEWAFVWNDRLPCNPMAVTGSGLVRADFVRILSLTHVTPPREEEEGEGEAGLEGGFEEEEEEEGEVEGGIIPPGGPAVEFVAVYDTARSIGELDPSPDELIEIVGQSVEAAHASCWKSLPPRLGVPRDSFVVAIVAITRNELDFAIEQIGTLPILSGQLRTRCKD
jgi:hypothetical protein